MTAREALAEGRGRLAQAGIAGESCALEAELLLADALATDRLRLLCEPQAELPGDAAARYERLLAGRARREPLQYLRTRVEFHGLPLFVDPQVLIPRQETETLVEAALSFLSRRAGALRAADIGTGSGAIALALLAQAPSLSVAATDLSPAALSVARRNADALGLRGRIEFACGDLLAPLAGRPPFDLIACNPPYLTSAELSAAQRELSYEPSAALVADDQDGTSVQRRLLREALAVLPAGGALAMELAPAQADRLSAQAARSGYRDVTVLRDVFGRERVLFALAA